MDHPVQPFYLCDGPRTRHLPQLERDPELKHEHSSFWGFHYFISLLFNVNNSPFKEGPNLSLQTHDLMVSCTILYKNRSVLWITLDLLYRQPTLEPTSFELISSHDFVLTQHLWRTAHSCQPLKISPQSTSYTTKSRSELYLCPPWDPFLIIFASHPGTRVSNARIRLGASAESRHPAATTRTCTTLQTRERHGGRTSYVYCLL